MNDIIKMSDVFMFQLPRKIIFGNGAIKKIGDEAASIFGVRKKVLMITDKGVIKAGISDEAITSLKKNGFDVIVFDEVIPDPPVSIVVKGIDLARKNGVEIILGIGGGSSIDTAKAVSLMVPCEGEIYDYLGTNRIKKPGLSKIFVPTTAGTGSELSSAFILTDDIKTGDKITSYSPYAFSDLSIIDPTLTLNLPPNITAETGMDAYSHALESFVSIRSNPLSEMFSLRGIELISKNIRKAYFKGAYNLEARYAMCFGVCMGTMAIRSSSSGLIHATCYPLAMKHHLSHGISISLMIPSVMEYNLISNMQKFSAVASAMGEKVEGLSMMEAAKTSVKAVRQLIKDLGLPSKLREIGGKQEDFPEFATIVMKRYAHLVEPNPRNVSERDVVKIYESAW